MNILFKNTLYTNRKQLFINAYIYKCSKYSKEEGIKKEFIAKEFNVYDTSTEEGRLIENAFIKSGKGVDVRNEYLEIKLMDDSILTFKNSLVRIFVW